MPHAVAIPTYLTRIFTSVSKQVLNTTYHLHSVLLAATTSSYTAAYATTGQSGLLTGAWLSPYSLLIGNQRKIFMFVKTTAPNVTPGRLMSVGVRRPSSHGTTFKGLREFFFPKYRLLSTCYQEISSLPLICPDSKCRSMETTGHRTMHCLTEGLGGVNHLNNNSKKKTPPRFHLFSPSLPAQTHCNCSTTAQGTPKLLLSLFPEIIAMPQGLIFDI